MGVRTIDRWACLQVQGSGGIIMFISPRWVVAHSAASEENSVDSVQDVVKLIVRRVVEDGYNTSSARLDPAHVWSHDGLLPVMQARRFRQRQNPDDGSIGADDLLLLLGSFLVHPGRRLHNPRCYHKNLQRHQQQQHDHPHDHHHPLHHLHKWVSYFLLAKSMNQETKLSSSQMGTFVSARQVDQPEN